MIIARTPPKKKKKIYIYIYVINYLGPFIARIFLNLNLLRVAN